MCKDNMEMNKKKIPGVMDRMGMDTFAEETKQHHGVMDRMEYFEEETEQHHGVMDRMGTGGVEEPTVIPAKENFSFKKVFQKEKKAPVQEEQIQIVPVQKVEKYARLEKEEIRNDFAEVRKNAYQRALLEVCLEDMKRANGEGCLGVLVKVQEYASLNLDGTEDEMQRKVMIAVRKELKRAKENLTAQRDKLVKKEGEYLPLGQEEAEQVKKIDWDLNILERYFPLFEGAADGYLKKEEIEKAAKNVWKKEEIENTSKILWENVQIVDGTKNIKLPFGMSWKNMKDEPLFSHEPTLNDIQQGGVGDCYFQAAMADMVVSEPEKLKECMRDNGDGTVTVRLFRKVKSVEGHPKWSKFTKAIEEKERISNFSRSELMKLLYVVFSKENALSEYKWDKMLFERIKKTPEYIAGYEAKKTVKEKKKYEEGEETKSDNAMNFIYRIFEKKELLLKNSNQGYNFAEELAEDARLKNFFDKLEEWHKQNPKAKCTQDTFTEIVKLFMDNVDLKDIQDIAAKQHIDAGYKANGELPEEMEMIPYYVTVKKEIPVKDGKSYYSHGAMWAHMLQKAYVASGIHKDRLVPKKTTYKDIASGNSDEAISMLTGEPPVRLFQGNVTANTFGSWIKNIAAIEYQQEKPSSPEKIEVYKKLLECLNDKMKATRLKTYTPKGTKTRATYAEEALTIESVLAEMRTLLQWEREAGRTEEQKEKFTAFMEAFQKAYPNLTAEQIKTKIENFVEKWTNTLQTRLENKIGNYQLQHERFAEKSDERTGERVGLYTQNALDIYGKIQDALQKRKPIGVGSQKYVPREVSSGGLNGEAMDGGFVQGHAYSIIGCKEIDGHKYIQLRNPWGSFGHGYKKITTIGADGKAVAVKYELREMDKHGKKDGRFQMELNDFLNRVDVFYGIQA